ncbi:mechanosensitive ion channel family protein [Rhizobium gallicum]|uniref:mechanosensitive ion channel family protein n=1 Tax=Rhizobium gallicum TaxID=56730 RepID=UPI001EF8DC43|nr:mechanosensitive ion channel family protein [Rhizobium gallicum]ULJ75791.1 mechanosensitive ion channel family protein [Rhizobium gallicum]
MNSPVRPRCLILRYDSPRELTLVVVLLPRFPCGSSSPELSYLDPRSSSSNSARLDRLSLRDGPFSLASRDDAMNEYWSDPLLQFLGLLVLRGAAKLVLPDSSLGRLLLNVVFFSALTGLLLYHGIPPYLREYEPVSFAERISNGALKTIWWFGGAMVMASSVRMFLIFERKPREGRLLQDLVVALIYLTAALCVVAYVFSLPVGTIIATSGVFAIVLGLALQSTLNDVFSGIALNLGRPLSVGDWVMLEDNVQGRVLETNWRSTQLLSGNNDLIVVPNSLLAKSRITNQSGPDLSHGASLKVRMAPTRPPGAILDAMEQVLLSSNSILKTSSPSASILNIDRDSIEIELSFRVADIGRVSNARNELFDLVYRHVEAAGLQFSRAVGAVHVEVEPSAIDRSPKRATTPMRLMNSIPLFTGLTDEEKEDLAANMNRLTFRKEDVIAHRDTALTSLMIIRSGVVAIEENDGSRNMELGRLAPGDFFGERGVLLGALELADVRALTPVVIYEIPKGRLAAILRERPTIADELALLLSTRTQAEEALHQAGTLQPQVHSNALSMRIKQFFRLS